MFVSFVYAEAAPADWQISELSRYVLMNPAALSRSDLNALMSRLGIDGASNTETGKVLVNECLLLALQVWLRNDDSRRATNGHLLAALHELKLRSLCEYFESLTATGKLFCCPIEPGRSSKEPPLLSVHAYESLVLELHSKATNCNHMIRIKTNFQVSCRFIPY